MKKIFLVFILFYSNCKAITGMELSQLNKAKDEALVLLNENTSTKNKKELDKWKELFQEKISTIKKYDLSAGQEIEESYEKKIAQQKSILKSPTEITNLITTLEQIKNNLETIKNDYQDEINTINYAINIIELESTSKDLLHTLKNEIITVANTVSLILTERLSNVNTSLIQPTTQSFINQMNYAGSLHKEFLLGYNKKEEFPLNERQAKSLEKKELFETMRNNIVDAWKNIKESLFANLLNQTTLDTYIDQETLTKLRNSSCLFISGKEYDGKTQPKEQLGISALTTYIAWHLKTFFYAQPDINDPLEKSQIYFMVHEILVPLAIIELESFTILDKFISQALRKDRMSSRDPSKEFSLEFIENEIHNYNTIYQ